MNAFGARENSDLATVANMNVGAPQMAIKARSAFRLPWTKYPYAIRKVIITAKKSTYFNV